MGGVRWNELSLKDLADLGEVLIIDSVNGLVDRADVVKAVGEWVDKNWPDRATWGLSDTARQAEQALMDGAQAIPRPRVATP